MNASANEYGPWTAPQAVPPARRRRGPSLWESFVILGIVAILAALLLPSMFTEYVTYYRCVICYALRVEHKRGEQVRYEPLRATEDSRFYESIAEEPHDHRWTKTMDSVEKSVITGHPVAFMSRDVSPLYYLHGEERRRLAERRLDRDGSLKPLEADIHAVQDAWENKDVDAARALMTPIWEDARTVDRED